MKKFLTAIFLIFLMITTSACNKKEQVQTDLLTQIAANEKFKIGISYDSKPFSYINDGKLQGFDVDLSREIAKRVFNNPDIVDFKEVTPSNRILMLNSKKIDAIISTMSITNERLRIIDFTSPYFIAGQAILVHKDAQVRSGKDLNGKPIGIVLGTTAEKNIRFVATNAKIKGYKHYKDAFSDLKKDKIKALSTDDSILYGIILDDPDYKILPDRYTTDYYAVALRKNSNTAALNKAVSQAIKSMEQDGTLQYLSKKWHVDKR
ncbi:MAG: transporter substrate-binding domain-containing protein [Candidatus Gastranaerophilales bacterium]|nr:transporter substrate-binding domain-containing protein [Candidatus Gastranaerophilales bacterium]